MRALLRRCDLHTDAICSFHAAVPAAPQRCFRIRQLQLASENRRDLIGRPEHAEAIGAVRRQIKLQYFIVDASTSRIELPISRIFRQHQNAFLDFLRQQLIVQTKLLG